MVPIVDLNQRCLGNVTGLEPTKIGHDFVIHLQKALAGLRPNSLQSQNRAAIKFRSFESPELNFILLYEDVK